MSPIVIRTFTKSGNKLRRLVIKLYNKLPGSSGTKGCVKKACIQNKKTITGITNNVAGCGDFKNRIIGDKSR